MDQGDFLSQLENLLLEGDVGLLDLADIDVDWARVVVAMVPDEDLDGAMVHTLIALVAWMIGIVAGVVSWMVGAVRVVVPLVVLFFPVPFWFFFVLVFAFVLIVVVEAAVEVPLLEDPALFRGELIENSTCVLPFGVAVVMVVVVTIFMFSVAIMISIIVTIVMTVIMTVVMSIVMVIIMAVIMTIVVSVMVPILIFVFIPLIIVFILHSSLEVSIVPGVPSPVDLRAPVSFILVSPPIVASSSSPRNNMGVVRGDLVRVVAMVVVLLLLRFTVQVVLDNDDEVVCFSKLAS